MATNKKKKGKKPAAPLLSSLKPNNLIVKKGRSMPIFECWKTVDGVEGGKADIIVARRMPNGHLAVGFYLVDLWCLGLKDTFYRTDITMAEFREIISGMGGGPMVQQIEPALAFNMIYAAIEYAEDLGFEPHKEFKTAQYLLPEPDDFEYIEVETGLNGRPCYYPGPDDRVEAVLAKLDKNVGKGNYDFDSWGDPRIHGDRGPNLYQVREQFFPDKKVDKKLDSLQSEDEKDQFMMQTVIVSLALELSGGTLENLIEEYNESDFLDDLMEEYVGTLNEIREEDGLDPLELTDQEYEANEGLIKLTMNRVFQHGSVEFMFEPGYKPLPDEFDFDNLMDNLPKEKQIATIMDLFSLLPHEERVINMAKMMALTEINNQFPDEENTPFIDEGTKQLIAERVWGHLTAPDMGDFVDKHDAEQKAAVFETIFGEIDNINEGKED